MHIAYGSMHIADVDKGVLGANGSGAAGISNSATTGAVTDNVSKAIASLGMAWSGKNVRIGQAGVGTQLTDSFSNMACAMLVPVVIPCALPLAVTGAFTALAVTSHERDLSALIALLMLMGIVVTNAIVLLDLVQHKDRKAQPMRS